MGNMRYCEQAWPSILTFWIAVTVSLVTVKFLLLGRKSDMYVTIQEMINGIPQNDSRLVNYVLEYHLLKPSILPYNLKHNSNISNGRNTLVNYHVMRLLESKTHGFFVECRAYEGEFMSKTLSLEMQHHWTGLLIEPDPYRFSNLLSKNRKAWLSNICLSPDPIPQNLDFMRKINYTNQPILNKTSGVVSVTNLNPIPTTVLNGRRHQQRYEMEMDKKGQLWKKIKVPCFPLFSLLSALDVTTVDYLSLDAQGLELQILHNIPWDSILINVLSVNVQLVIEGSEGVKSFMKSKEYWLAAQVHQDYIFAHKNLLYLLSS